MGFTEVEKILLEELINQSAYDKAEVQEKEILDVGSGAGRISMELAKANYRVIGIDTSRKLIEQAKHQAEKLSLAIKYKHIQSTEVINLPFNQNCFDHMIAFKTYCYIPGKQQRQQFLEEAFRLLKPNGKLFMTQNIVPEEFFSEYEDCYYIDMKEKVGDLEIGDYFPDGKGYVHWFTEGTLKAELLTSSFHLATYESDEIYGGEGFLQLIILEKPGNDNEKGTL